MKKKISNSISISKLLTKIEAAQFHAGDAVWLCDLKDVTEELSTGYQNVAAQLSAIAAYLGTKDAKAKVTNKQRVAIDDALREFLSLSSSIRRIKNSARIGYIYRYSEDAEAVSGSLGALLDKFEL